MEEISPQLIAINIILLSCWNREEKGLCWLKRQTPDHCCTIEGDFLSVQQITYKGTTSKCHPKFKFPAGWDMYNSFKITLAE